MSADNKILYTLYMTGRQAVCPVCSGMVLLREELNHLWCIDCTSVFEIEDVGKSDKEVLCIKSA